jgi:hypothetical protein
MGSAQPTKNFYIIKGLEKSTPFFIACNFNAYQLHTILSGFPTFQLGRQIF